MMRSFLLVLGLALLWVQSAQRAMHNEALEYAVQRANEHDLPLVAVFGSTAGFPHANERHLAFMYRGLIELRETLETSRGIQLLAYTPEGGGEPGEVIVAASAGAPLRNGTGAKTRGADCSPSGGVCGCRGLGR